MKQRVVYLAISLLATSSLTAQEAKKMDSERLH